MDFVDGCDCQGVCIYFLDVVGIGIDCIVELFFVLGQFEFQVLLFGDIGNDVCNLVSGFVWVVFIYFVMCVQLVVLIISVGCLISYVQW